MAYTYTTLSDFRGKNTFAHDINDSGDIVGFYGINGESFGGFVDIGGKFTTLHDPLAVGDVTNPQAVGVTFAFGINNNGDIVGYYFDSEGVALGFVDVGGKYTTLYDPSSTHGTVATGIDDYGDIVGYYFYREGALFGFVDISGKYTTLLLPGAKQTAAFGFNDNGEMVVGTYLDFKDVHHGFVTSVTSVIDGFPTYTTLNDPLGTKGTYATGINDNGDIAGNGYYQGNYSSFVLMHSSGASSNHYDVVIPMMVPRPWWRSTTIWDHKR